MLIFAGKIIFCVVASILGNEKNWQHTDINHLHENRKPNKQQYTPQSMARAWQVLTC